MAATRKLVAVEATDENVLAALKNDVAGRRSEVISFCEILDSIEGYHSLFLDSLWGYGKTYFVKEVAMCLRHTLKAMQLLGFNYKEAIGTPLTRACASAIERKLGVPQVSTSHQQPIS